jgi:hypothetical protein
VNKIIYTTVASFSFFVFNSSLAQDKGTGLLLLKPQVYAGIPLLPQATRGPLPPSATLENMFPSAMSQGNMGSCTAWAVSYAKAYRIFKASKQNESPDSLRQSPAFIHSALTDGLCKTGTFISQALEFVKEIGSVSWATLVYDDKTCYPKWADSQDLATNESTGSFRLSTNPVNALQQMREAIADGNPVILAINACKEFKRPIEGYIGSVIEDGSKCEAHAVLAVGYSDDLKAIRILNSWGQDWGNSGKVWMDYKVFSKRYLQEAYVDYGPTNQLTWKKIAADRRSQANGVSTSATPEIPKVSPTDLVHSLRTHISSKSAGSADILGVNKPVSQWSIWLNLPKDKAAQITSVDYYFHHRSFRNPKTSVKGSSIFITQWLGHGCTHSATVKAKLVDGSEVSADFDYCTVLANSRASDTTIPTQKSELKLPEIQSRTALSSVAQKDEIR